MIALTQLKNMLALAAAECKQANRHSREMIGRFQSVVVAAYEKTLTRYGFASGVLRFTSKQSGLCLAYLKNDFPNDIRCAKADLFSEEWWSIPAKVIDALLGKPKARSFASIASGADEMSGGPSGFSPSIRSLQPLKPGSDMHTILGEHYARWRPPSPT